jgi:hypothetical protein
MRIYRRAATKLETKRPKSLPRRNSPLAISLRTTDFLHANLFSLYCKPESRLFDYPSAESAGLDVASMSQTRLERPSQTSPRRTFAPRLASWKTIYPNATPRLSPTSQTRHPRELQSQLAGPSSTAFSSRREHRSKHTCRCFRSSRREDFLPPMAFIAVPGTPPWQD